LKIVLRKEDSSTSSLLFVYNLVYSRIKTISLNLSSLLEFIGKFGKTETATRMALSRACKAGILDINKSNDETVYSLTPVALQFIYSWNADVQSCWKRFIMRNMPWEGKWHFVHIAPIDSAKKGELSEKFEQIGYVQINAQTWLSSYRQTKAINSILDEIGAKTDTVSVYGEFESNIGTDNFLEKTFGLSRLSKQYTDFTRTYQPLLSRLKDDPSEITEGKALPILHKLGYAYFANATKDPMLPRMLLPEWPGDQAAIIMRDLRRILETAAWEYLKNFS
jgi:phenylacetic acid degradation operon negative regulatory protein